MRAYPSQRLGRPPHPGRGRRNKTQGHKILRWLGKTSAIIVFVIVLLSFLIVLPMRWINPTTTAFMLQDSSDIRPLKHEWVSWDDLGDALPIAVVASEDQTFAVHVGFDVKSIRNSVDEYNKGQSLRGASTITQQVAKNLYLWPGRSFLRKGIEAYLTTLLEAALPKKRILEIYLNVAEFGPGIYGAGAASKSYFGKAPSVLGDAEAALLAAVLPNPKRLKVEQQTSYLQDRQSWIIEQMERLRREQWLLLLDQ